MLIGFLQCGHFPQAAGYPARTYSDLYSELLAGHGLTFRTWSVVDMEFPESVHDADGWLVTGSRHGAYENLPFIPPLEDFIRKAYAEKVPLVGICFGHQIIAQALGGRVEKVGRGWAVGRTTYDTPDGPLTLDAWHQDQVVALPEGAEILAANDFCPVAAMKIGPRVLTYQPHPEFTAAYTRGLLTHRGPGVVPDTLLAAATAEAGRPNDSARVATDVAEFLHRAKVPA
jgi:GMP synthase-like glutamine amidotransferase